MSRSQAGKPLLPASWTLKGPTYPSDLSVGGGGSLEDLLCPSGSRRAEATVRCITTHHTSFSAELLSSQDSDTPGLAPPKSSSSVKIPACFSI